jgi:putative protein kinase ArgK-like GTPase of G3E family
MSRYEDTLEEFENGNDDEKHKLVYAHFGLAVYQAQVLEEAFSIMLWTNRIFKKQAESKEEINEIIDAIENSKKTMGNFLNEVKQNYGLTVEHLAILEDVLNRRNFIVHKFFKIEINKFYSNTGKKEMIKYLCDFIDDAVAIDSELDQYYAAFKLKLGFTDERIEDMLNEVKTKELERDQE